MSTPVEAHLADCALCRGESDALKEVDRQLLQLAAVRRSAARTAWNQENRPSESNSVWLSTPSADNAQASTPHRRWLMGMGTVIFFASCGGLLYFLWLLSSFFRLRH